METQSFSSANDLSPEQRQAVESMVGRPLDAQDAILVVIMRPGQEPTAADKARARARLERVFDQVDRYGDEHGITADGADTAIDAAVQAVRSLTS